MIGNGKYKARATTGALGKADTGSYQVLVDFEITDGDHKGSHLAWFGYFTEKTQDRTIESLRHCGWVGDDLDNLTGINTNEVQIVVELEEHDGKTRPKIQWVNALGSGMKLKNPLSVADAKSFAQRMKGAVIAQRAKAGAAPNGRPAGARRDDGDPGPADEDLF
jgi:hypothetical protein